MCLKHIDWKHDAGQKHIDWNHSEGQTDSAKIVIPRLVNSLCLCVVKDSGCKVHVAEIVQLLLFEFGVKMYQHMRAWVLSSLLWIATVHGKIVAEVSLDQSAGKMKSAIFKSPAFILGPGQVQNKWYIDIGFPKGHIALKRFHAEVVNEDGKSIPLSETYLHHWLVGRFYYKNPITEEQTKPKTKRPNSSDYILVQNDGICQGNTLRQYFGLGSETRHTSTFIPDPYGIIVGDPNELPEGYKESWYLNVHAIDTRGVVNTLGCTECKCDLYNVTEGENHHPFRKNYVGGLDCCYDGTQCQLKEGVQGKKIKLYLKYTVYWRDWEKSIIPVKIYILDVTYSGEKLGCQIEYDVPPCSAAVHSPGDCVDIREANMVIPQGGNVIYSVGHQHTGGAGLTLYGQDGREICTSLPLYGEGREPGNETGYVVGMSTCYPKPESVQVHSGETLKLQSKYSKERSHIGVMGLFYLLVADPA